MKKYLIGFTLGLFFTSLLSFASDDIDYSDLIEFTPIPLEELQDRVLFEAYVKEIVRKNCKPVGSRIEC